MKRERLFSKRDLALLAGILVLAAAGFLVLGLSGRREGASVRILLDGQLCGTYDLHRDRELVVACSGGFNRVVIEDGQVYVAEADCPDGWCVRHAKVSRAGEVIVCLPHRLVVEIGGSAPPVDAYTGE